MPSDSPITVDFCISVGCACRPAYHLRKNNLSICSNPLDWMMRYELSHVIDLFKTDFRTFFQNISEDTLRIGKQRFVTDTTNGMVAMHSFPAVFELEEYHQTFLEVMHKRYCRMLDYIQKSDTILFLCNRYNELEYFSSFLCEFYELFPKKYFFINMKFDESKDECKKMQIDIAHDITFIEYRFYDTHKNGADQKQNPFAWHGNTDVWKSCLSSVYLSERFIRTNIEQEDNEQY